MSDQKHDNNECDCPGCSGLDGAIRELVQRLPSTREVVMSAFTQFATDMSLEFIRSMTGSSRGLTNILPDVKVKFAVVAVRYLKGKGVAPMIVSDLPLDELVTAIQHAKESPDEDLVTSVATINSDGRVDIERTKNAAEADALIEAYRTAAVQRHKITEQ